MAACSAVKPPWAWTAILGAAWNSAVRRTWRRSTSVRSTRSRSATTPPTWAPRSAAPTQCAWTTWCCIKPPA
ncbi:hypothetical protein G6F22_019949 [Rhizopus arrhizus]|nr:hypothetical protein G6F22_019949 [Rhizopus arrhizus]KAG0923713.1 hypothetical protein G6F31_019397 [Rhizopus arrhizus]KAG1239613.1 hypothetical protein G6F68_018464 [Rhizopus microsporus]